MCCYKSDEEMKYYTRSLFSNAVLLKTEKEMFTKKVKAVQYTKTQIKTQRYNRLVIMIMALLNSSLKNFVKKRCHMVTLFKVRKNQFLNEIMKNTRGTISFKWYIVYLCQLTTQIFSLVRTLQNTIDTLTGPLVSFFFLTTCFTFKDPYQEYRALDLLLVFKTHFCGWNLIIYKSCAKIWWAQVIFYIAC